VDFVDCATIPTMQPCAGAEQLVRPSGRLGKTDRMSETDVVNSRQDFVAPFFQQSRQDFRIVGGIYGVATQSGTQHRFKPKEAAGSARTLSILGRSLAVGLSLIQDSSRRSARNCIDPRAPLVGCNKNVGIISPVRGNQLRSEQMTMTAAETAHGRRDSSGSILEVVWQHHTFPRPSVENRTDGAVERRRPFPHSSISRPPLRP